MKNDQKSFDGAKSFTIGYNEIMSSDRIKMFGMDHRRCRFETEILSNYSYPFGVYTKNLCLADCRIETAIQMCGCRPFFYKTGDKQFSIFKI